MNSKVRTKVLRKNKDYHRRFTGHNVHKNSNSYPYCQLVVGSHQEQVQVPS